jgi:hypothetical protein
MSFYVKIGHVRPVWVTLGQVRTCWSRLDLVGQVLSGYAKLGQDKSE